MQSQQVSQNKSYSQSVGGSNAPVCWLPTAKKPKQHQEEEHKHVNKVANTAVEIC